MAIVPRAILLIGDGMSDRPVAEFGEKTPLEAAKVPHLNRLAKEGECGLMDPIAPGVRAGSDTSHLALLGYDPHKTYTGRGPFEAAGIGMEVKKGDICFRCNFSTVDDQMKVVDRRAGRIDSGTEELAAALNGLEIEGVTCYFKESVEHRAALVLRGEGLGHAVTDADPHQEGEMVHEVEAQDQASRKTAQVVNYFVQTSYERLDQHPVNQARRAEGKLPANIVLPRGAGVAPHLEAFSRKYGFAGACVVEVGLIKGIGRYLEMEVVDVPEATGGYDTNELALAKAVIAALNRNQFVICNFKAPDLAGHDADFQRKVETLQKLDHLAAYLLEHMPEGCYLILTADHSTPISVQDHSGDPVPIVFWGPGVRVDSVTRYDERSVTAGGLGRIRGMDLMNILTNLMGTQEKFGA